MSARRKIIFHPRFNFGIMIIPPALITDDYCIWWYWNKSHNNLLEVGVGFEPTDHTFIGQ